MRCKALGKTAGAQNEFCHYWAIPTALNAMIAEDMMPGTLTHVPLTEMVQKKRRYSAAQRLKLWSGASSRYADSGEDTPV